MLTLTLSRVDVSKQWQSGNCILISQDVLGYNISVTCSNATLITGTSTESSTKPTATTPKPTTTTPKPTTTTPKSTTTTPKRTTTTPKSTTTTPKPTTTTPKPKTTTPKSTTTTPKPTTTTSVSPTITTTPSPTQPRTVISTGDTDAESTTVGGQTGSGATTDDIEIGIIAGAVGGGGLLLIVIIVVIIIRKKSPGNKQPFDPGTQNNSNANVALSDDIPPYPTIASNNVNRYPNDDEDTRTFHNSLYVSVGLRNPGTNHIIAGTGDMYAQVQKQEKRSTVDATVATDKLELEETPQGAVYAVVNKPEKQNENDETDDNRPSRYTNQDGLVYAEVGVQDMTSRPNAPVTSRPPPVSPKPKADTENVMYAEVNTSV